MSGHTPGLPSALVVGEGVPNGTLVLGYELSLKDKGTAKLFALGSFPSEARDVVMEIRNRWNAHADLVAALLEAQRSLAAVAGLLATYPRSSNDPHGRALLDSMEHAKAASHAARAAVAKAGGA